MRDLDTHKESLRETRLIPKVGAKVVLLSNINPKGGLVNGSQGEVVGFVDTNDWRLKEPERKGKEQVARRTSQDRSVSDQRFPVPDSPISRMARL